MRMALSTLSRARAGKKRAGTRGSAEIIGNYRPFRHPHTVQYTRSSASLPACGIGTNHGPSALRCWLEARRSAVKRNEQTQATGDGDVVHDLFQAELHALLLMDRVAHVPADGEPIGQVEFHARPEGTGQTSDRGLNRCTRTDGQIEVVAADPSAHPTHLAVGHGPDQMAHEKLHGVVLGTSNADQILLA